MNLYIRFTIIALFASLLSADSHAQHFMLDTTFQFGGIDTLAGSIPSGIIHRPGYVLPQVDDKKIVIVGDIYYATSVEVMRLNYNGTFDSTFNDSGKVVVTRSYIQTAPSAVTLYDTSKILLANTWLDISTGWEYIAAYNFKSNGTLNTAFGSGGVAHVALSGAPVYCYPYACGAQTDGKFVIMGTTLDPTTGTYKYALTRLLPSGSVDATYGSAGIKMDPYPMLDTPGSPGTVNTGIPRCGLMDPDNKFVVVGMVADSPDKYNAYQLFVTRHNMDGSPDLTFGYAGGITMIKDSADDYEPTAIAEDSAGNYYIFAEFGKWAPPFTDSNYAVIKLDHSGHRVTSYGLNGVKYLQIQIAGSASSGFAVQKNGCVIIPGITRSYTPVFTDKFIVFRLDSIGNFDTSFNTAGLIITQRDSNRNDICVNAGVQPDGRILLVGYDSLTATSICMRFTNNFNNPFITLLAPGMTSETAANITSSVYPNPATSKSFSIRYSNPGTESNASVYIYDATGQPVSTVNAILNSGTGTISCALPPALAPGIYYVALRYSQGGSQVHALIVF